MRLQTRYGELAGLRETEQRVVAGFEFEPSDARPNFYFAAYALVLNLADVVFSEQRLIDDDDRALTSLGQAGIS